VTITTFDDPEDIVEELLRIDAEEYPSHGIHDYYSGSVYVRAAEEILRLRRVLHITEN